MGDLKNPNKESSSSSSPISLPPGFRFHPSDHQLCSYYLSHKNHHNRNPSFSLPPPPPSTSVNPILVGVDVIREIDLYNYDPCDLPEFSSYSYGNGGSKKHWYYFTVKGESEGCRRRAKGGFWKCKGKAKDVRGGGGGGKEGIALGRKRSFVFFRCNLTRLSRTNWIMVEYSLVDHHHVKDSFVLCRVFLKSVGVNKGVENVPGLCAKECIAAKQKICISVPCKEQDAPSTSGIVEVTVLEDTLADKCNNIKKSPLQLTGVQDDAVMVPLVPDNVLQSFVGVPQSGQPVKFFDWYIGDGVISDDAYTLLTMDGDFLELDDLDCPLLHFDSAG